MQFREVQLKEGDARVLAQRSYERQFASIYIAGACQVQVIPRKDAPAVVIASPLASEPSDGFIENPREIAEGVLTDLLHDNAHGLYFVECYCEGGYEGQDKEPRYFGVSFDKNSNGERHRMSRRAVLELLGDHAQEEHEKVASHEHDQAHQRHN